jgi:undecaprenyl-diphosphatase
VFFESPSLQFVAEASGAAVLPGDGVVNRVAGLAQAVAILPGISRSGATISTAVLLGVDREKSARFSFLMVVPLILGKMAKDLLDGDFVGSASLPELGVGFVAAFFTGIAACVWMIKLVKKAELKWFAYYCFSVAAIVLVWKGVMA